MERIAIVGGGLAGSLVSVFLAKRGFDVHLFEKRPDMRNNKISAGKSINLALSERGINALKKVGIDQKVLATGIPMTGRMMHNVSGELAYQPYGKDNQAIYSVSRGLLNIKLLELADELPNIQLYFNSNCVDANLQDGIVYFEDSDGNHTEFKADRVIGSDGAFSAIRYEMQTKGRFDYSQTYLHHGYKELCVLPNDNGEFKLDKNCLHIWPRESFMLIALPNLDGTFTCTLFFQLDGPLSFNSIKSTEDLDSFFDTYFPDVKPLIHNLHDDFFNNPTGQLCTVRCFPWTNGKMALIGDAAHAVVPFYGQGMNCSFEDCVVFDELLEKHYPDWNQIFSDYQTIRKPNADAIANLALQNFIEMRDRVGDKNFLHYKHVEHDLCSLYPEIFKSQYELVTFSNVPYKYALEQGERNTALVNKIISLGLENKLSDHTLLNPLFDTFLKS